MKSILIDPFRPADGPPPQKLRQFFAWGLQGAWPLLFGTAVLSVLAGMLEVSAAIAE